MTRYEQKSWARHRHYLQIQAIRPSIQCSQTCQLQLRTPNDEGLPLVSMARNANSLHCSHRPTLLLQETSTARCLSPSIRPSRRSRQQIRIRTNFPPPQSDHRGTYISTHTISFDCFIWRTHASRGQPQRTVGKKWVCSQHHAATPNLSHRREGQTRWSRLVGDSMVCDSDSVSSGHLRAS